VNRQDAEVAKNFAKVEPGVELDQLAFNVAMVRRSIKRVVHNPQDLALSASWRLL